MASKIPAVPYKAPFAGKDGYLSPVWANWFRDLFQRIGGNEALTNQELEGNTTDFSAQISSLQTQVTTLSGEVDALQSEVGGLTVGRQL